EVFTSPLTGGSEKQVTCEENGISNYHWLENSDVVYYQTNIKQEETDNEEVEKDLPTKKVFTKLVYKADGSGPLPEDRLFQIKRLAVGVPKEERSEEHTSELQSRFDLVCGILLEKKKTKPTRSSMK